ncbi:MAG: murein biosynthesis integral membrane protein MurJ [Gammaproteobacteria bacterium]|nr:murein biosynthesis integral membrane protein MurJ [Gammaproteobacteria bacterium]
MTDSANQSDTGRVGLLRAGSIVSFMTLLSRILGFVRDQVLAIMFGAGLVTDVFLVAWKIPNFLRKLFAEGAFAQAFVPVFAEYRKTRDPAELRALAANVSGTLSLILLLITTLGVMLAPLLILLFAPGFADSSDQFDLATHMLRITFPYLIFVSLLAYAGSILNTFGRFAVPSITPVLLNICMILAALYASPYFAEPIVALAWGVFIAGVVQLLFQLPFLQNIGMLPRPRWGWRHPGVRKILKLMAPVIFGSSVAQINILLDTIIASFLAVGSLSWLYYSDRLLQFPLGVLGVTLATVILPRLSTESATASIDSYRATINWALRITLLLGLPAAIGLFLLAEPLLTSLFQYGQFSARDTRMASYSLIAYSLGLPAYLLIKVFLPAFFARQNTRTPVRIGIIALLCNMVLNIALVVPMVYAEFIAPHMGLAIASTLTAWQQAIMLYRKLASEGIYQLPPALLQFTLRLLPALLLMIVVIVALDSSDWSAQNGGQRALQLIVIIGASVVCYTGGLFAAGIRPADLKSPE